MLHIHIGFSQNLSFYRLFNIVLLLAYITYDARGTSNIYFYFFTFFYILIFVINNFITIN